MTDTIKQIIKNINDGEMIKTQELFTQAIAQKVYDQLETKKQEMSQTIFNKPQDAEE